MFDVVMCVAAVAKLAVKFPYRVPGYTGSQHAIPRCFRCGTHFIVCECVFGFVQNLHE